MTQQAFKQTQTARAIDKKLVQMDFDRAAKCYDEYAEVQKHSAQRILSNAKALIPEHSTVLDLGSGTGALAKQSTESWYFTQLDLAYAMCILAHNLGNTVNGDMEHLPFAASSFDAILSCLALQWSNPEKTFMETSAVLKPSGYLVAATLGPNTLHELREVSQLVIGRDLVSHFLNPATLTQYLGQADFANITIESREVTLLYDDAYNLMKVIKGMGGSNKQDSRHIPINKRSLLELSRKYEQTYGVEEKIPATWEILYITAQKT